MIDIVKKHLADLSASNWIDYKAALTNDVVYEEFASRTRAKGADEYVKAVQRWKRAFPDLKAKVLQSSVADNKVLAEIEWEGTHDGPFEGPFGTIQATHKRGSVRAAIVFTLWNGKITEAHHYFDLLTVLSQLGVAPMAGAIPPKAAKPGAGHPAQHR